ncbi:MULTISPECIES: glucosyl-3-phosphoglycerate synthase [Pseudonocardia]|uniref:Glucosyl-3-phosphoglycerate synthase n=1 Tax=Pseudonocardia oroxyli TaxID=366584 RepID=A0A1G7QIZ4_PSEOR|nr:MULTISPECIES: glucosyl-3-phosphoglycerate synthase [Pseudonocardia]MCF7551147.1 glucosyl-3-phosphoglycerate synthase [Pseudonocardia sp. WMMC193]SDF98435.1 glucosyl-3-phosphoglycerate synthase [Pseudonocardia oroxyli]
MQPITEDWFTRRTWQTPDWTVEDLVAAKRGRKVSVVLPALNEEATIGAIVAGIRPFTEGDRPLVDDLLVMDSGSTDDTIALAKANGARVALREDVVSHLAPVPGKGEVLWRSLAATDGDIICFIDSDLVDFDPTFVPSLLGPLLLESGVHLVKGFYRRPLRLEVSEAESLEHGGGRVTELVARPLLSALRPELAGIVQPLGGEYAGTRELLESVPFATSYGVEIGLLLDTVKDFGLDAIAQVNLGVRKHRNRNLMDLGVMSRQITATALRRAGLPDTGAALTQFVQVGGEWVPNSRELDPTERPPMREMLPARKEVA